MTDKNNNKNSQDEIAKDEILSGGTKDPESSKSSSEKSEKSTNGKQEDSERSMAPQVDERIKYYILAIAAILVIAVVIVVLHDPDVKEKRTEEPVAATEQAKVYPRQFDYFVTKNDENYDEYMAMIKRVEEKYKDQVMFTITDIDEDPSARDNFPIDDFGTPMLIVVTDTGNITAMEGKCADEDKITGYIEDAIGDNADQ